MANDEVRWERLLPDELEAAFARCPVLYLPYGLCEPHGPHTAVGLDGLAAHALACAAAREHGGIVAPASYWHIHDFGPTALFGHTHIGELERSWLTAVTPWQFWKSTLFHVRMADCLGFEAVVLLTGHWSTVGDDLERFARLIQPFVGARLAGLGTWTACGVDPDHAGRFETSLLWALEPDCVDMARLAQVEDGASSWAVSPDAGLSDRRYGERLVAAAVRYLGVLASKLRRVYDRDQPDHAFRSYEQLERLWEEVLLPALPQFGSAAEGGEGEGAVPTSSVWYANWHPGIEPR